MTYGIDQARRGWLEKSHVLNAMTLSQLQQWLKLRRQSPVARHARSVA
jgi:hypothetical protein